MSVPGYCIACIVAGRDHRRNAIAGVAPGGVLGLIAGPGGAVMEAGDDTRRGHERTGGDRGRALG